MNVLARGRNGHTRRHKVYMLALRDHSSLQDQTNDKMKKQGLDDQSTKQSLSKESRVVAGILLKPSIKPNNRNKCHSATLNQSAVYCLTFIFHCYSKSKPNWASRCMSHSDVSLCKTTRNNTVLLITTMSGKKRIN